MTRKGTTCSRIPIYFRLVTGILPCFMQRFLFAHLACTNLPSFLYPREIPTACMDTMNISEPQMNEFYRGHIVAYEAVLPGMFGYAEYLSPNETLQFEDKDRVFSSHFDPEVRKERHMTVFPEDFRRAHVLGDRLAGK